MNNPNTKKLLDLVEQKTGYRVVVDVVSGIYEHAQMSTARPAAPVHVIRVNSERLRFADYIVAVQCCMLLIQWSEPTKVPSMVFDEGQRDHLARVWAQTKPLTSMGAETAVKTARFYVDGLLKQLFSSPLEIRVANFCFGTCPTLRLLQAESFNAQLREYSEIFSPKIRDRAPSSVFEKNAAMNAALALNWSRISGDRIHALPYESTGFAEMGEKLLQIIDALPDHTSSNHIKTVDAWAEQLELRSLYSWELTNRVNES